MENLIKRLQDEAGLTQEQAIKSISVIKDFMDKEGMEINWDKFFKGKYGDFKEQAKNVYENISKQTDEYADKIANTADEFAEKAKQTASGLSKKVSDFFDGK